jgi:N-acetylmuramoyl-L-alanine amidase
MSINATGSNDAALRPRIQYRQTMVIGKLLERNRQNTSLSNRPGAACGGMEQAWMTAMARLPLLCRTLAVGLLLTVPGLHGAFAQPDAPSGRAASTTGTTAQPVPSTPVAIDARLDSTEHSARFTMAVSQRLDVSIDVLDQPLRIVADLPEVNVQAAAPKARRSALVPQFRAGLVAPGRSRIVFDLAGPARVKALVQRARSDGIVDFTIEFEPVPRADFDELVAAGAERRARSALAPLQIAPRPSQDRRPLLVIDPGHGGIDPGAVATGGVTEKAVVLAIGLKLKEQIEAMGQVRVIMTRADDRFLSLSERVRVAREARADLFVSLHADSLSAAQDVRGATIYTGSDRATDAESARLAQKENAADALGGAEAGQGGGEVVDILMDLALRETRAQSGAAAARLVTEMSGAVKMHRIPQRAAGFRVLTAPDVPSLLIELGFLSSKSDIALLTSAEWQGVAAEAIARAVSAHFSARAPVHRSGASISP